MSGKSIKLKNKNNEEIYPYPYFPIGYVYISINNTNPSTLFGGNWEQLKDRFLLGAGDNYRIGTTGGEEKHTLTVNEMPSHNHGFRRPSWYIEDYINGYEIFSPNGYKTSQGVEHYTVSTGGNQAHNNMPPYLVVYMWVRVS